MVAPVEMFVLVSDSKAPRLGSLSIGGCRFFEAFQYGRFDFGGEFARFRVVEVEFSKLCFEFGATSLGGGFRVGCRDHGGAIVMEGHPTKHRSALARGLSKVSVDVSIIEVERKTVRSAGIGVGSALDHQGAQGFGLLDADAHAKEQGRDASKLA